MVTSRQAEVISTIVVLTAISTVILAMRVYARFKKFGMDDWLMVAAYVWILFNEAASFAQVRFGSGEHDINITSSMFHNTLKATYVWHLTHIIAICLVKISILTFYLRLSVDEGHRIIIYAVTAVTLIGSIVLTGTNIFQCTPVSNAWNPLTYPQGCINIKLNMSAASVFHITTDATIYLLPIPVILTMQTSTRRKVGLISIFVVGAVPVAASICRFYFLATLDWSRELMWQGARVNTFTAVELNVALMAACMPAVKSIFFGTGHKSPSDVTPNGGNAITLSIYPSNHRPETIDTESQGFELGQAKPGADHVISVAGIRLPGVAMGRPTESQECIVQGGFDTDKGSTSSRI